MNDLLREYLPTSVDIDNLNEYQLRKLEWLDDIDYTLNTKKSYWMDINKLNEIELAFGKDIYQFSKPQIEDIIQANSSISIQVTNRIFSCINIYIQWTIQKGINTSGNNPCSQIILRDIIKVNKSALKESYIELLEYLDLVGKLKCSDVDKMILVLLRYGVNIKDIITLKCDDIDKQNECINIRELRLPVDYLFFMFLDKCKECNIYKIEKKIERMNSRTGEITEYTKEKVTEYRNTEYVIKPTLRNETDNVEQSSLYTRVRNAVKDSNLTLSVNTLNDMRKYDLLYKRYNKNGSIDNLDIKEVLDILEGNSTSSRMYVLKNTFELLSGIKVVIKR